MSSCVLSFIFIYSLISILFSSYTSFFQLYFTFIIFPTFMSTFRFNSFKFSIIICIILFMEEMYTLDSIIASASTCNGFIMLIISRKDIAIPINFSSYSYFPLIKIFN